jgi:hypothetical protein
MPIKNAAANGTDDLRAAYDLSKLKGGVRGKYYERATAGTTLVLLEPDVAEAFPDGRTVNQALRALIKVADARVRRSRSGEKLANRPLQPTSRAKGSAKKRPRPRAARG